MGVTVHTYLVEQGIWNAAGVYQDAQTGQVKMTGTSHVMEENGQWQLQGTMKVELPDADDPVVIKTAYTFDAWTDAPFTRWQCENPMLGPLHGKFIIDDNMIMSNGKTADGRYQVIEAATRIDESTYEIRGGLLEDSQEISAWAATLTRE